MTDKLLEKLTGTSIAEEQLEELKKPSMYKVILLNDDYTPMEFVVLLLQQLFFMDEERATRIMLQIHTQGKGFCGLFTRDVAETKVNQVNQLAQHNEYPLFCAMEPE